MTFVLRLASNILKDESFNECKANYQNIDTVKIEEPNRNTKEVPFPVQEHEPSQI